MVPADAYPVLRFGSKKDWWITAIFFGSILVMIWAVLYGEDEPVSRAYRIAMGVFTVAFVAFMLWIYYGTFYVLSGTELKIRSGPIRSTIMLNTIEAIEPSRSPLSSPALSMDRLHIRYGRYSFTMISPEDKQRFVLELVRRTPSLQAAGGGKYIRATGDGHETPDPKST